MTLKTHKDALHAFMKPSQLLHLCTDNHIIGHIDLGLRSIAHYWNAKPFSVKSSTNETKKEKKNQNITLGKWLKSPLQLNS